MPPRFCKPSPCIRLKSKIKFTFWISNNVCSPILVTRMVAAPPMKAFGNDETHGAALVHGRGGAFPCLGVSTIELCLCIWDVRQSDK